MVLDTGLAADEIGGSLTHCIRRPEEQWGPTKPGSAESPEPFQTTDNQDLPDANKDRWIDPVAGHGTFIGSLISRLAPNAKVEVGKVIESTGEGNDADLTFRLEQLLSDPPDIVCLSCSCVTEDDKPPLGLASVVGKLQMQGTVIVAAAGNDASCRACWPAALPDVISVGALGPDGPAPFTNWGPWVRACAPGVDIVSNFFDKVDRVDDGLPQSSFYFGWASWSGTSFATPIVAGALAREMGIYGITAEEAADRVVFDERLYRFPGLGTVVNLH